MKKQGEYYILPKDVIPVHYALTIRVDLEKFEFIGQAAVNVKIEKSVDTITVHSLQLNVSGVEVRAAGRSITATGLAYDKQRQIVSFTFDERLPVGDGILTMKFIAPLQTKMDGFYRSSYVGPDGKTRWIATTQFEPGFARLCFPCWDEPACKATFSINLNVQKDRTAISNMPILNIIEIENDPDRHMVKFEKSPIMSTYLVAMIVGDFDYIQSRIGDGVQIGVYVSLGKQSLGKFALDTALNVLQYYIDYFDIEYPLPKLDLIAIPDFAMGAMENWGLVTYRERRLLYDPVESNAKTKQMAATTIAHELAHQWFGNLVTMQWWTHLWLNEGYAVFCQTICTNHLFPEFKVWQDFSLSQFIPALQLDSLESTHPIEVKINTVNDIQEIFDTISYSKGACVIRMLHKYIGDEDFRKGMTQYLRQYQYKNAKTSDLWKSLGEASPKPVEKVMSAWTLQPGYPIITVVANDAGDKTVLTLTQRRFYLDGRSTDSDIRWPVPVDVICSADSEVRSVLLEGTSATLSIPKISEGGWVKINPESTCFYRTKYDQLLTKKLVSAVKMKKLSPVDRINVLDDMCALSVAGFVSTVDLLDLLKAYADETEYYVLMCVRDCLEKLCVVTDSNPELRSQLNSLICEIFEKPYEALGWESVEGESFLNRRCRPMVLSMMGECNDPRVISRARSLFEDHVSSTKAIDPDLRFMVYRVVMNHGDETTFEQLKEIYNSTSDPEEKYSVYCNIAATRNEELLEKAYEFIMTDVRPQDILIAVYWASTNSSEGSRFAWNYLKQNYLKFSELYSDSTAIVTLFKHITANLVTASDADDVLKFFESQKIESGTLSMRQTVEKARVLSAWIERESAALTQYLSK